VLRIGDADFLFDRDTRIIADLLAQAGEGVEQRGLAAIRIADHRIDGRAVGGLGRALASRQRDVVGELHVERSGRLGATAPPSAQVMADSAGPGGQALDQNAHGGAVVEGDAGAVDEAKAGGGPRNLGDERGLAKTHLPHALAETFVAPQLAHTTVQAGGELTKGMKIGAWRRHGNETEYQDSISKNARVNQLS